jgi:hypothetical protein
VDEGLLVMLGMGLVALLLGVLGLFAPPQWNPLQLKKRYAARVSPGFARSVPKVMGAGCLTVGLVLTVVAVLMALGVLK